jgi:hypothetical protein
MFPRPVSRFTTLQKTEPARAASKSDFSAVAQPLSKLRATDCDCSPLTWRENLLVWTLMIGGTSGLGFALWRAFA